jgi:hypothetical protein
MKRVRREVEGRTQPLDWRHGIYHKGAGEEDKTSVDMRPPTTKALRERRGNPKTRP